MSVEDTKIPAVEKKILMVIAQKGFRDEEFAVPRKVFLDNGFKVVVASDSMEEATGKYGAKVMPDAEISGVDFTGFDAVVVVGGPGALNYLGNNKAVHKGLSDSCVKGGVVAAICISPVVLAKAGVLQGRKATVFPDGEAISELKRGKAEYIDRDVVADGNIVTGRDYQASENFAVKIAELLLKGRGNG